MFIPCVGAIVFMILADTLNEQVRSAAEIFPIEGRTVVVFSPSAADECFGEIPRLHLFSSFFNSIMAS